MKCSDCGGDMEYRTYVTPMYNAENKVCKVAACRRCHKAILWEIHNEREGCQTHL